MTCKQERERCSVIIRGKQCYVIMNIFAVVLSLREDPRWLTYHGAAEGPEPPQQEDDEQQHQDEKSDGHKLPVRLEEEEEEEDEEEEEEEEHGRKQWNLLIS